MSEVSSVYWRVEYGEISENEMFRIGIPGSDTFEAYFPLYQLQDLITVLATLPVDFNIPNKGTYLQARKVTDGLYADVLVEPRLDSGDPAPILRYGFPRHADLLYVLQLLAAELSNLYPNDWDFTNPLPVVVKGPDGGIKVGTGLQLREIVGNGGYRLLLESTDQNNPDIMPYFEVRAATEGNDIGGAIGGYQAHWIGDGTTPSSQNRLYWFVELHKEGSQANPGRPDLDGYAAIGVSSRNGVPLRSMVFAAGGRNALAFQGMKPYVELLRNTALIVDDRSFDGSAIGSLHESYINMRRESAIGIQINSFTTVSTGGAYVFLSRHRGSVTSPLPPNAGDNLGRIAFGMTRDANPDRPDETVRVETGAVRGVATGTWDTLATSSRGTKVEIVGTRRATTVPIIMAEFDVPETADYTGLALLVNKAGTVTTSYVRIGEPDSAGVGFRSLRIAN